MSLHADLRTQTAGDPAAPTIVFLHGLGITSWMWDEQVERLADRFHCVTVDMPGQGRNHDRLLSSSPSIKKWKSRQPLKGSTA